MVSGGAAGAVAVAVAGAGNVVEEDAEERARFRLADAGEETSGLM